MILPTIPQQPSESPPSDAALLPVWRDQWSNYRWAVDAHQQEAMRAAQVGVSLELAADLPPRRVGKAEVVLARISVVPPSVRATEGTWSADVMLAADALWNRMQADSVIKPLGA